MISYSDLFRISLKIGLLSFGGPAAQIALMHKVYVDENGWLNEAEFLRALSLCMLLPGPEAMQLATYAGWKLRGVTGGLISGGLFVLPGALVILVLAHLYMQFGELPVTGALFTGIKACVVVIVFDALRRLARKALKGAAYRALAITAFLALFVFQVPFPLVVFFAGITGAVIPPADGPSSPKTPSPMKLSTMFPTLVPWLILWAAPVVLAAIMGMDQLVDIGMFFAKLAVVTFGGAYAVLAYMTQEVVLNFEWLSTQQMIDALGLAETTPGPLILVTEFVGILAGGTAGGIMTLWVTFIPCFLWIFALAPFVDGLAERPRLAQILAGVTAAVVGVIANLSVWFALHVFFARQFDWDLGPVKLPLPDIASFQIEPLVFAIIATALLIWRKLPLPLVLGFCAVLSLLSAMASEAL